MKIGVNTLFLVPGDVGGTEIYLRETLAAMAGLGREHSLVLFTNRENDQLLRSELGEFQQVSFHPVACRAAIRPLRILAEQFLLPFAARKYQLDVLWSPGYTAPAFCFSPQAVTIHDLQYKSYPEDMSFIERVTLDSLVRIACKQCQAVITVSEFSRQEVIRYNFCSRERTFAVSNGVRRDFFFAGSATEASDLIRADGIHEPFLLCVAHTYPHKNVDKLINAFALLQDTIPHQLVLVGKERRGEEAVTQALTEIREPCRVLRLSNLAEKELQALYQQAELFVLPSAYEGFGLPILEAMMAGTAVLTVNMASLPEVGGKYARYVDSPEPSLLADRILQVLRLSPQERTVHIEEARQWAANFTWEKTAIGTFAVLAWCNGAGGG